MIRFVCFKISWQQGVNRSEGKKSGVTRVMRRTRISGAEGKGDMNLVSYFLDFEGNHFKKQLCSTSNDLEPRD